MPGVGAPWPWCSAKWCHRTLGPTPLTLPTPSRSSIPKVAGDYTILNNIGDGNNATVRACVRNSDILSSASDERQQRNSHGSRGERESGSYDTDGLTSPLVVRGEGGSDGFGEGLGHKGGGAEEDGMTVAANSVKLAAKIIKKASVTNVSLDPGPLATPATPATPAARPTYPMPVLRVHALAANLPWPHPTARASSHLRAPRLHSPHLRSS